MLYDPLADRIRAVAHVVHELADGSVANGVFNHVVRERRDGEDDDELHEPQPYRGVADDVVGRHQQDDGVVPQVHRVAAFPDPHQWL